MVWAVVGSSGDKPSRARQWCVQRHPDESFISGGLHPRHRYLRDCTIAGSFRYGQP